MLCPGQPILKPGEHSDGHSDGVCSGAVNPFRRRDSKEMTSSLRPHYCVHCDASCLLRLCVALRSKSKLLSIVLRPWQ